MPNVLCRLVISISLLLGSYGLPSVSPNKPAPSATADQVL
jgi:hypothetical protein